MDKENYYIKHFYWLGEGEVHRLAEGMETRRVKFRNVKGVMCLALHKKIKIAIVGPEVWNDTCARQGSWYRSSAKNGRYLIVSDFELEEYAHSRSGIITLSDFVPPQRLSEEEKREIIAEPDFQKRIPEEWRNVSAIEKKRTLNWVKRLGSDVDDYGSLYLTNTANHANFINPRLFTREADLIIPYSIDRTAHLCSCCLELFGVIGEDFSKKLVAPCAGASIFTGLEPDRFLLVKER